MVDTDVVVIAIAMFDKIDADELWLSFGTGSNFRYIPIHEVVNGMDPRNCAVLLVFHTFTGCDNVSSLVEEERRALGRSGRFSQKLLKHLNIFF